MADYSSLRKKNLLLAKRLVRESVNPDLFIINAVNNAEELQRVQNNLAKRLREWYSLYFPELDKKIQDHEEYITHVLKGDKHKLLKEWKVDECMGSELDKKELEGIRHLAESIRGLYEEEKRLVEYLEKTMKAYSPNLNTLAGAVIGAKLLRGAGSLRKLAMMRSSTIQLIGAEKALFRHIKTGAKPPKYGHLLQHPLVQRAKKDDRGRMARALADKIFVAVRIDYFKGEYKGDELLKEVEVKLR
ncbi:NOP58 family protein [Candidatus Woesearchaeota archaeon]|nr:NOP58 family protein [Candidatus Woesearchaeota archaeon]